MRCVQVSGLVFLWLVQVCRDCFTSHRSLVLVSVLLVSAFCATVI